MPIVPKAAAARGLSYRAMTDDDLPFAQAVYISTRLDEVAATGWPAEMQHRFLQDQFRLQHAHYRQHYPSAEWLIIERDDVAIGRLYVDETATQVHVIDIALLADQQRSGFGTAILSDLLQDARGSSKGVVVYVEKNNPALALYHRLGFEWVEDHGPYQFMIKHPGPIS
jgi:ribosomal protein S18 acetylase RimI-like enzyme